MSRKQLPYSHCQGYSITFNRHRALLAPPFPIPTRYFPLYAVPCMQVWAILFKAIFKGCRVRHRTDHSHLWTKNLPCGLISQRESKRPAFFFLPKRSSYQCFSASQALYKMTKNILSNVLNYSIPLLSALVRGLHMIKAKY